MCTNKRWIRNKYNGRQYFVNCGHCEACQQEKTHNVFKRIINTFSDKYDVFFITLTYQNRFIPYIRKSAYGADVLDIYRDARVKKIRATTDYDYKRHVVVGEHVISTFDNIIFDDPKWLHSLHHYDPDKVGVIYYPDVQKYFKRFRQILIRRYAFYQSFKYFCCSEYGTKKGSFRPHFHILLFFPRGFASIAKCAHNEAWPYDSLYVKERSFEYARKPAQYLSGYLNKSSELSKFLETKFIRSKHSYSKMFGCSQDYLSLSSLLQKIKRGDLTFDLQYTDSNGCPVVRSVLYPRYVANRYFPRFKGDYKLSPSQIYNFIKSPFTYHKWASVHDARYPLDLDDDQFYFFTTQLAHCFEKFKSVVRVNIPFGSNRDIYLSELYAQYYVKFWISYYSTLYKRQFDDVEFADLYQLYDNFADVQTGHKHSDYFSLYLGWNLELDPNKYPMNIERDSKNYMDFIKNRNERELNDVLWSTTKDYNCY